MVTTPVAHATFTDLLALLFPTGTDGYLKLVAEGSQRATDHWFRRSPEGAWLQVGHYAWREPPTPLDLFVRAHDADLFFSPLVWAQPALGIPGAPTAAGWASLRVGTLGPTVRTVTLPRVDAASATLARQRFGEFRPEPSLLIDEGDRLSGLWLVQEPFRDLGQLERALRGLTARLGAQYEPPAESLVGVPGTRNTRLLPTPTTEVVVWQPERRYAVGAFALP